MSRYVEMREYWQSCSEIIPATEEDWGTEYLDAIISVKIVDSIDEAITHINTYNTGHSESIITKDYDQCIEDFRMRSMRQRYM